MLHYLVRYSLNSQRRQSILILRLFYLIRNFIKVEILLSIFEFACQFFHYYVLDFDLLNLRRTLFLFFKYNHVTVHDFYDIFDDNLRWISIFESTELKNTDVFSFISQKLFLFLDVIFDNIFRDRCAEFLFRFASILNKRNLMLVFLDETQNFALISNAYNDNENINRAFNANAFDYANVILNEEFFKNDEWNTVEIWNKEQKRHKWNYKFRNENTQNDWKWKDVRMKKKKTILKILNWNYDVKKCENLWETNEMRCLTRMKIDEKKDKKSKHCECYIFILYFIDVEMNKTICINIERSNCWNNCLKFKLLTHTDIYMLKKSKKQIHWKSYFTRRIHVCI